MIIYGEPMGKQRPRVVNGHAFTPKKTVNYETLVREMWMLDNPCSSYEGELRVEITAYYGIPKSASRKKQEAMARGEIRPTKKPDLDNVAKIILDSLNGLAYRDDSQVVEITVRKFYSDVPRVEVKIEEV